MQDWLELAVAAAASAGAVFVFAKAVQKKPVVLGPTKPKPLDKRLSRLEGKCDVIRITLPSGDVGTILVHDDGYATDFDPSIYDAVDFLPQTGRKKK